MNKTTAILTALIIGISGCSTRSVNQKSPLESLANIPKSYIQFQNPPIQEWITKEGSKVLFLENTAVPMFDVQIMFDAGSSRDGNQHGLAALTSLMLGEGIASKNANQIAEEFENLGVLFSTDSGRDAAVVRLRSLSEARTRDAAVNLFSKVIGKPSFPVSSLARIKNQLLTSFKQQERVHSYVARNELFKRLYANHPYAHNPLGNAVSVSNLTRKSLIAFHASAYAASNATIAIVGDLSEAEAKDIASQISSNLPRATKFNILPHPKELLAVQRHVKLDGEQSYIALASLGVDRYYNDYAALMVANHILGGSGLGSRLMTEVREKRGLTYGIYSQFIPMRVRGPFIIDMQTNAKNTNAAVALIKQILRDYIAKGPTEQEFSAAKSEMLNSFAGALTSNASMVNQLSSIGFYRLPLSWIGDYQNKIQKVTLRQTHEAIKRLLDVDKMVVITAGPNVRQDDLLIPYSNASQ